VITPFILCLFSLVLLLISDRDTSVLEPLEMFAYATMIYGSLNLLVDIFCEEEDE
jgi:hypothetical protein